MSPSMAFFTFLNAWWISLFLVVPFFVKSAENPAAHEYKASPQPVPWKKVLLVDTLVALAATVLLALIIGSGYFPMDTL